MDLCEVYECSTVVRSNGFCAAHYMKNYRYGTPTPEHPPTWVDLRGIRFGPLVVEERRGKKWLCRCDCGGTVEKRAGDLNRGPVIGCGDRTAHPVIRATPAASYSAAHRQVVRVKGRAREYQCMDCAGPASQWSYNHQDPNQLISKSTGFLYSPDVSYYEPRCVTCHHELDRAITTIVGKSGEAS